MEKENVSLRIGKNLVSRAGMWLTVWRDRSLSTIWWIFIYVSVLAVKTARLPWAFMIFFFASSSCYKKSLIEFISVVFFTIICFSRLIFVDECSRT